MAKYKGHMIWSLIVILCCYIILSPQAYFPPIEVYLMIKITFNTLEVDSYKLFFMTDVIPQYVTFKTWAALQIDET